jgi:hypothetical protein
MEGLLAATCAAAVRSSNITAFREAVNIGVVL